jgi:MraZ protein
LSQRLATLPITQSDARAFSRYLFAGGVEVDFDPLGRIKIPDYLLKYAQLDKAAMILGVLGRVEIWGLDRWQKMSGQLEKRSEEIAEKLGEKGF